MAEPSEVADTLQRLEALLKSHEWYYDYYDDSTSYFRGARKAKAISELMEALEAQGKATEAEALYNKYKPDNV